MRPFGHPSNLRPPHRPRANGRAEVAGPRLLSILKRLHLENGLNWVQALPRALMTYHDVSHPGGLSPYHIMFDRDRLVQGIPYIPERSCEDAIEFFQRMELIDQTVSKAMQTWHQTRASETKSYPEREPFSIGSLVWVLKPPQPCLPEQAAGQLERPLCCAEQDRPTVICGARPQGDHLCSAA